MDGVNIPTVPGVSDLGDIFAVVINIILGLGWALMFVMLPLGIIRYIVSKGEPKAVHAARDWIIAALLGGIGLFFITTFQGILFKLVGLPENATIGESSINPFRH